MAEYGGSMLTWSQVMKSGLLEINVEIRVHSMDYSLGYIHTTMPTGKLTPRQSSLGLGAWNGPWNADSASAVFQGISVVCRNNC